MKIETAILSFQWLCAIYCGYAAVMMHFRKKKIDAVYNYCIANDELIREAHQLGAVMSEEYRRNPTSEEIRYQLSFYEQKKQRADLSERKLERALRLVKNG